MSEMSEYVKHSKQIGNIPKDQFGHAFSLLARDETDIDDFQRLLQNHILLANIKDDKLIRLYQNDGLLLTSFYDMQRRYAPLSPIFKYLYYGWIMELGLTRIKDGKERILQAMPGTGFQPTMDNRGGYGFEDVRQDEQNALGLGQKEKKGLW